MRKLLDTAKEIEGLARNAGTHAAGVVISAGPLMEYTPLVRFGDGGINTQYDMDWIERIGLLKMDFLGLRNLTVMENAVREIRRTVDAISISRRFRSTTRETYRDARPRRDDGRLSARVRGHEARLRRAAAARASKISSRWSRSIARARWIGSRSTSPTSTGGAKPQYLHPKARADSGRDLRNRRSIKSR